MDKKVFAIIVIYNGMRRDWIRKCFDSLLASTIPIEIIAVDNCSSDDSVHFIKKHYPGAQLIESTENIGFGGANNIGMRTALDQDAEYILLLNQDAWVETYTVEHLVKLAENNKDFGVISPMHMNGKGSALDFNFSVQTQAKLCRGLYSDAFLSKFTQELYTVDFVCAAAWLLPSKTLRQIGGFSPAFYHYGEDDNFCHRVRFHKLKIGIDPLVKIFHDREDRAANTNQDEDFLTEKFLKLNCFNPNSNFSPAQEEKRLLKLLVKSWIKLHRPSIRKYQKERRMILNIKRQYNLYYQMTKESGNSVFL